MSSCVSQQFGGGAYLSNTTGNFSSLGNGIGLRDMFAQNIYPAGLFSYWYNSTTAQNAAVYTLRKNNAGNVNFSNTKYPVVFQVFHYANGALEVTIGNGNWTQVGANTLFMDRAVLRAPSAIKNDGNWHNVIIHWDMTLPSTSKRFLSIFTDGMLPISTIADTATSRLDSATIASGGTGYGADQTFQVQVNGGTYTSPGFIMVRSNNVGVVTSVVSIPPGSSYTALPNPTLNAVIGGSGTNLLMNLNFSQLDQWSPSGGNIGIPYKSPGTFFFVGADAPNPATSTASRNGFIGILSEVWFSPMTLPVCASKPAASILGMNETSTATVTGDPHQSLSGGSFVWFETSTNTLHAGKIGREGNDPILPYPNNVATVGMPPVYLSGRGDRKFETNHAAGTQMAITDARQATTAFKVQKPPADSQGVPFYAIGPHPPPFK